MLTSTVSVLKLLHIDYQYRILVYIGLCYILLEGFHHLLVSLFSIPTLSILNLTSILPIPLVLISGPISLLGIPTGYILADIAHNSLRLGTLVGAGAHLYLGYSAYKVAQLYHIKFPFSDPGAKQKPTYARLTQIIGIAAGGAAAITGWGSELVRETPFYIRTPHAFGEYFIMSLLASILVLRFLPALNLAKVPWSTHPSPNSDELQQDTGFNLRRVIVVTFVWILFGTLGSLLYRIMERIPPYILTNRNLEFLLVLDQPLLFGQGAGRLQVVFGAVLISILLLTFINPEYSDGDTGK